MGKLIVVLTTIVLVISFVLLSLSVWKFTSIILAKGTELGPKGPVGPYSDKTLTQGETGETGPTGPRGNIGTVSYGYPYIPIAFGLTSPVLTFSDLNWKLYYYNGIAEDNPIPFFTFELIEDKNLKVGGNVAFAGVKYATGSSIKIVFLSNFYNFANENSFTFNYDTASFIELTLTKTNTFISNSSVI